ncbi:MAG: hypothetical protein HYT07_00810 [Candidatus Levybacteria bacterium]|nr:hypothetical protein [Candidatus Levybacteria bacterium]
MIKLPFLPQLKKKVETRYFLVLILRQEKVNAVIFQESENKVKIIGQEQVYFSESIEDADLDEFLEVLDKAISQAESSLPENIETHQTIFGVKEDWTQNNQIKKEYLIKLKKACEELELTPIGFLVISQAIAHLLQKEEGAPLSAILVEVNKKNVTITLIKGGKIIETKTSEIHNSIPFTVDTLLKYFQTSEVLPSRIIIFNGKEDLSQEFIGHSFSKSLPFLHLPQITSLPEGFDAKSVLSGVTIQMGFEMLEEDMSSKEHTQNIEEKVSKDGDQKASFSTEDFGFVKDQDIAKMSSSKEVKNEKLESIPKEPAKEKTANQFLTSLTIGLGKLLRSTKKIKFPKGRVTLLIPTIILLILGVIASYFLFVKATIVISLEPNIIEKDQKILFSTTSPSDPGKNIINGELVTISENGSVSIQTTGKKEIGTKAKGAVTIFNSLSQSKTLEEGSVIKSPNNLEFTLDKSITIKAVASHSADEVVNPEKETVNVTSQDIGKEYNLPSGTKFNVGSFEIADLVAKNDNPFSGGTKKEVTVVSEKDSNKLKIDLPNQLERKAMEELSKELSKDRLLLPVFISSNLVDETMDAKVGDEVDKLTLKGSVEYKGILYKKDDLIVVGRPLLEKDLPKDQKIDYNNVKANVKNIEQKNDEEIEAELTIKGLLLPKIDENKLKKEIKGTSFTKTEDLLYKLSQVSNVDIVFTPNLPFLPKKLPLLEKNIKIVTEING